jgi:hypothetical protein
MLALNDLVTTNGDTGYVSNSYSIWFAPGTVDLAAFTGVSQKTLSMDLWLDTESGWDYVKALVKSAADTTDTWMILGSNSGNMGAWGSWDIDLAPVDTMTDAQFALLFDSDPSIIRGFGALVDNIQVHGRDVFVAMAPSNLTASNFEDGVVNLAWSAPGTGGQASAQYIDIYDEIEPPPAPLARQTASLSKEQSLLGTISADEPEQTKEEWLYNKRKENPKFNTHPKPYFKTVEMLVPSSSRTNSRSLSKYNVFRKTEGANEFALYDTASVSGSYVDNGVINFTQYEYYVTAVYDEGESGPSNSAMGVPGVVVETVLPLLEDFHAMNGPLPVDWSTESTGVFDWSTGDAEDASGATFTFPYHGEFVYVNNESSTTYTNPSYSATLVTPFFRHENIVQAAYLKFETYVFKSYDYYGSFEVMVRNTYGPWTTVASLSSTSDGWETAMFDISDHVVGHNYVQVGFRYNEGYYYYRSGWGIDNVKIGLEPGPDNLTAESQPGAISLDWGMPLSSLQDPGGTPSGIDENGRPEYLTAPNCEECEEEIDRIPGVLFGADFHFGEASQFVEYNAVDSSSVTNWAQVYSDANSSGSFDEGDPSWMRFSWTPTQYDFDQWLISDGFDASGVDTVVLMFDEYLDDYSGDGDTAAVHVSYDDGDSWTTVWEKADSSSTPSGPAGYWERHVLLVGAGTAQMKVAFSLRGVSSFSIDYWHVDNILILDEIPQDHYDYAKIYRDGELIAEEIELTVFTDYDVIYGQEYCYQVQLEHIPYPVGDMLVTGLSNTACGSPGNQNPTAPDLLTPEDNDTLMVVVDDNGNYVDGNNNSNLSFTWEESEDLDGHEILYNLVVSGEFELLLVNVDPTAWSFTGPTLELPYSVLVPAIASIGEIVVSGTWVIEASDGIGEPVVSEERFLVVDAGFALSIDEDLLPDVFALHQNYPNPFNPVTTIRFDVPQESHIRMDVYNILGQRIRTLVNGTLQPGFHAVRWNGTNDMGKPLASGMYIYRIHSREFTAVKKLVLMK